jgi:hypothetical protein
LDPNYHDDTAASPSRKPLSSISRIRLSS